MKLLSISLLLASVASVRSASRCTIKFMLTSGITMTDPTGNPGIMVAPDSFDLVVNSKFTAFERKVKATDSSTKVSKDYLVSSDSLSCDAL